MKQKNKNYYYGSYCAAIVILTAAIWLNASICESPPILSPAEIPFAYDANVPNVIGYLQINRGEVKCWDVQFCDDTNEISALVAASTPIGVLIEPNDYYLYDKYLNAEAQQQYTVIVEGRENNIGVNYLTLCAYGKYHRDPNELQQVTIVIRVDPNAGEPPVIEPPLWKPCAVNP